MLKIVFVLLGIIGMLIISFLAFQIPKNPFEIVPGMTLISFGKPLWLCILIIGIAIYLFVIYSIYKKIKKSNWNI